VPPAPEPAGGLAPYRKIALPLGDCMGRPITGPSYASELSMSWVDPSVRLGGDFSVFGGLGWAHCSKSTCTCTIKLKALYCVNAFKRRLYKISLQQATKFGPKFFTCIGLGQSVDGVGWIGSHKMDP